MALNRRAKKRLGLLLVIVVFLCAIGGVAWLGRQFIRDRNAAYAREEGLSLWEAGDFEKALPRLSSAVSRNQDDVDLLIAFAETRSRVPLPGNRNVITAIGIYRNALHLQPENLDALTGLMYLQIQAGMVAQLTDTAQRIRVLDPDNPEPLQILKVISESRGRLGPTSITKGTEEDDSALRYVDELIELDPNSIKYRLDRFAIMEQIGRQQTKILDIAKQWAENPDAPDGRFHIVLAHVYAIQELREEARKAVLEGISKGLEDPTSLLIAIDILRRLGETQKVDELELIARERALTESSLAYEMTLMPWRNGFLDQTTRRVAEFTESLSQDAEGLLLLAKINAATGNWEQTRQVLNAIESLKFDRERDITTEKQIRTWTKFLNLIEGMNFATDTQKDLIKKIQLAEAETARMTDREFTSMILGDLYQRIGLASFSIAHYRSAVDPAGVLHAMPAQRLISSLLMQSRPVEALPISELLIRRHPRSAIAVIQWIKVRAALERQDLVASEEGAILRPYMNSYDLAQDIVGKNADKSQLYPLLIETSLAGGMTSEALSLMNDYLELEKVQAVDLVFLAQLASGSPLLELNPNILDLIYQKLLEVEPSQEAVDAVFVLRTQKLRNDGNIDEAEIRAQEYFKGRDDPKSQRLLVMEEIDNYIASDPSNISDRIVEILDLDIGFQSLSTLAKSAIRVQDLDFAIQVKERADELFGFESQPSLLIEADLVLGFPNNPRLDEKPFRGLNKLVGDLELQLDREPNSTELVFRQFRLLDLLTPEDPSASTELLLQTVTSRPDALEFYPPLIMHLQELGRFREADRFIQRFEKRKFHVAPALREAVDQLRFGQGDPKSALAALKRSANAPNATVQEQLRYSDALIVSTQLDEAQSLLTELMANPQRPIAVDHRFAYFLLQKGDHDGAVKVLRSAPGFPNDIDRVISIATLLLQQRRPIETIEELNSIPGIYNESARANLIAGNAQMSLGNADEASELFGKAIELGSDSESLLLAIATTMLESFELRDQAILLLNKILKSTDSPGMVEVMLLGAKAANEHNQFEPTEEQLVQAHELIEQYPGLQLAWTLLVNFYFESIKETEAEFRALAQKSGQPNLELFLELRDRHLAQNAAIQEILKNATNRFAADSSFPRRLAKLNFVNGDYESALRFSDTAIQRSPNKQLADEVEKSAVLIKLGRHSSAVIALLPYSEKIMADSLAQKAGDPPTEAYRYLVEAYLLSGQVDKAKEILIGSGATSQQLAHWESISMGLEFDFALPAIEVLRSRLSETPDNYLRLLRAWTVLARKTNNPMALEEAIEFQEKLQANQDTISDSNSPPGLFAAQVELAIASLQDLSSISDARNTYLEVVEMVPLEVRRNLTRIPQLTQEERNRYLPWVQVLLISLNNYAANSAKLGTGLAGALSAANEALSIAPNQVEILDTRAMVHIAMNNANEAVMDALISTSIDHRRLDLKLTLAEAYAVQDEQVKAMELISEIERNNTMRPIPDENIRVRADKIRESLLQRQAG